LDTNERQEILNSSPSPVRTQPRYERKNKSTVSPFTVKSLKHSSSSYSPAIGLEETAIIEECENSGDKYLHIAF